MVFDSKLIMKSICALLLLAAFSCSFGIEDETITPVTEEKQECLIPLHADFSTGADNFKAVFSALQNKKIGLVANPSSQINGVHLVDSLVESGLALQRIFCPEHGFRGEAAAGEKVDDSKDLKTGIPIVSLYGKHKKPTAKDLEGLDILVFDIQDVGARFYTYISTLHYVMEAAAEHGVSVLILDRPNPNGHCVDGPILDSKFSSFVGMHEVPVLHGMTIGEYGQMINGEGWLEGGISCDLKVIPCENYTRNMRYELPIKPSPNLPNFKSVLMYPSLCFFEGTAVSVGRGTETPFQVYGHPKATFKGMTFTPKRVKAAPHPKLEGKTCAAFDFSDETLEELACSGEFSLKPLLEMHSELSSQTEFFTRPDFFDLLAGSDQLRLQITEGLGEEEIRKSWQEDLSEFRKMRSQYLIYP